MVPLLQQEPLYRLAHNMNCTPRRSQSNSPTAAPLRRAARVHNHVRSYQQATKQMCWATPHRSTSTQCAALHHSARDESAEQGHEQVLKALQALQSRHRVQGVTWVCVTPWGQSQPRLASWLPAQRSPMHDQSARGTSAVSPGFFAMQYRHGLLVNLSTPYTLARLGEPRATFEAQHSTSRPCSTLTPQRTD